MEDLHFGLMIASDTRSVKRTIWRINRPPQLLPMRFREKLNSMDKQRQKETETFCRMSPAEKLSVMTSLIYGDPPGPPCAAKGGACILAPGSSKFLS